MTTATKFDILKFDGKINCNIWKVQMITIFTQNGLKKALGGKAKKPDSMTDEQWEDLDEKALFTIQLYLASHVLREALDKTTTTSVWLAVEVLYMTKTSPTKSA